MLNFNKTKFITSAPDITKLPYEGGIEIAFVGRSNAGKSSALNKLANIKRLAKTSKTPGRTQLINLFEVEENKRIVDLPGYGYADVPKEVKLKWQKSLTEYLQKRQSLKVVVVLMDIRHPLKDVDRQIISWATVSNLNVVILLTKSDKLKLNAKKQAISSVKKDLIEFGCQYDLIPFSSLSGEGVEELKIVLSKYFEELQDGSNSIDELEEKELEFDEEAWNKHEGI